MKRNIVSLALFSTLILSMTAFYQVRALPADSMWIEPSTLSFATNTTPVGTKFNVTTWLNVATPTNNWQFYLIYNKAQLNAVRTDYSGSGKSLWSAALPVDTVSPSYGSHDGTRDYVVFGEVLKGSAEKTGEGSLAWVEFQIMQAPLEGETLTSDIALDVEGVFTSQAFDKSFTPIPLNFGKATYTYSSPWTPPPPAKISLDPPITSNRTLTECHNFTVNVKISEATNVSYFDFKLTFNNSVIKAWEATLEAFFPPSSTSTIEVNNASGYVRVIALLEPSEPPRSGSGILSTITFHVEGNGSTMLHFMDIQLKDNKSHLLPLESFDGTFSNTALTGDVNSDGKVDIQDVAIVSGAFGSYLYSPLHPRWDPRADIAPVGKPDGRVDVLDVAIVRQAFGLHG